MKFKHNEDAVNGTYYVGDLTISYDSLVKVFGEPTCNGDHFKVSTEWCLKFEDGTVATIYDWKECKAYCGPSGKEAPQVTCWHIGGLNGKGVDYVKAALLEYIQAHPTNVALPHSIYQKVHNGN